MLPDAPFGASRMRGGDGRPRNDADGHLGPHRFEHRGNAHIRSIPRGKKDAMIIKYNKLTNKNR